MKKVLLTIIPLAILSGIGFLIYKNRVTPSIEGYDSISKTATIKWKGNTSAIGIKQGMGTIMGDYSVSGNYDSNNKLLSIIVTDRKSNTKSILNVV